VRTGATSCGTGNADFISQCTLLRQHGSQLQQVSFTRASGPFPLAMALSSVCMQALAHALLLFPRLHANPALCTAQLHSSPYLAPTAVQSVPSIAPSCTICASSRCRRHIPQHPTCSKVRGTLKLISRNTLHISVPSTRLRARPRQATRCVSCL
jgi:hypothetical protein